MGHMKDLDIRIRMGGDDAVAAACELAGIVKERRGYEDTMRATSDITDIVTVLRSIGFASVPPSAGESASLLHYCVTHAADEIEHLREGQRWIPVSERLPEPGETVLVWFHGEVQTAWLNHFTNGVAYFVRDTHYNFEPTHWMNLPSPPEVTP